ncbi:DUF3231 family protein [Pelotomaculum propionicicum]|uniref:DUF3231 family protein n=1 Tax=Pelotomaculum propionicicum TaxID=258475 RepID=UPI003B7C9B1A
MANNTPITSSELGTLWMTYLKNKLLLRMLDYFIEKENDKDAKDIMSYYYNSNIKYSNEIEQIFKNEGAAIPIAFTSNDVHKDAPPLWDNYFDILFLRLLMKLSLGFNALHQGMSYRSDIVDFYKRCTDVPKETYDKCNRFLLKKGILARPPYVSMPKEAEFIEQKTYMKGVKLFGSKRSLNTVEIAHIYNALESNVMGTQLMTGFAQGAKESEVRDYFIEGKELAKKIVSNITQIMQESDIQAPSTWAGRATDSTAPPFSDKMMMFCSTLLSSFALGANAIGTSLSLRSDLPKRLMEIAMDTYQFASKGGQLMIKHNWLEEPPQMEDRNELTKSKK